MKKQRKHLLLVAYVYSNPVEVTKKAPQTSVVNRVQTDHSSHFTEILHRVQKMRPSVIFSRRFS